MRVTHQFVLLEFMAGDSYSSNHTIMFLHKHMYL